MYEKKIVFERLRYSNRAVKYTLIVLKYPHTDRFVGNAIVEK